MIAKKNNIIEVIELIQVWQGNIKSVFDASFINGAQYKNIMRALNDLGSANLILQIEFAELMKLYPEVEESDMPTRIEWIRQDIQRISGCLSFLRDRLDLIDATWTHSVIAEIDRLLK